MINLVEAGACWTAKLAASMSPPDILRAVLVLDDDLLEEEKPKTLVAKREGSIRLQDNMVLLL